MKSDAVIKQILNGSQKARKSYTFNQDHAFTEPAQMWFQQSTEGLVLFIVFYSQACRWSRCLGCNLPSMVSQEHVSFQHLMAQVDYIFSRPDVIEKKQSIQKVIVSNNGSVLDEATFSSTALMYLISQLNIHLHKLSVLTLETRPEYVDLEELEFLARALVEGETQTKLELAIGFEAYDNHIRNEVFDKGMPIDLFEEFVKKVAKYRYRLKCYFMQKPVPHMTDEQAVSDIQQAIDYLGTISKTHDLAINMHLNPTYVAKGTILEESFQKGEFVPPRLIDVARAALHAKDNPVSIFIGLSDEGLAVPGGSFIREGEENLIRRLEEFNQSQDYSILEDILD